VAGSNHGSYAWARHTHTSKRSLSQLSPAAREGLDYASELADDAYERSRDPQRHHQLEPLTIDQLADEYDLPATLIRSRINLARRQLFGRLTDNAIYRRSQRQRARPTNRPCQHPDCPNTLPDAAPGNSRYCAEHASGKERVRRHRNQQRLGSRGDKAASSRTPSSEKLSD
jgi:hypothetical protein